MPGSAAELLGRFAELEAVDAFINGRLAAPRAILLRGEPGIGKTALWTAGKRRAADAGMRVLSSSGVQAEMPLGFANLSDLLDLVLSDLQALPQPHRRTLAVAARADPAEGPTPDRLAVCRAFLEAMRFLARAGPVFLALDDVQWLDAPSVRVLSFALRRLDGEHVLLLATLRGGPDAPDPLGLSAAFGPDHYREIDLEPLTSDAICTLVSRRVDYLPRAMLVRLYSASRGNPLFALEFARSLHASSSRQRRDLLSVPASLRELIRDRVAKITPKVRPLLELVAVIEHPKPSVLALAMGRAPADELLGAAIDVGLLALTVDGLVRFTHPLIASAVYSAASPSRQRELHRQAAALAGDEEEQARHLALSLIGPDGKVASLLERAATRAAARGAPETAADLADQAMQATPEADANSRYRRILSRGRYLGEAGDVPGAQRLLDPLLDTSVPPAVRARALIARADCEFKDRLLLIELLRRARDASTDRTATRWHVLIRYAQLGAWVAGDGDTAIKYAREATEVAEWLDDPELLEQSQLLLGYYNAAGGRTRALPPGSPPGPSPPLPLPAWQIAHASAGPPLMWAGELTAAREVFQRQHEELVKQGSVLKMPFLLLFMTELEWRAGDWTRARLYAEEAVEILSSAGPAGLMVAAYASALMAASSGRAAEARTIASQAIIQAETQQDKVAPLRNRWVLGHLELSLGDPAGAWQSLEGLPQELDQAGIRNPGTYPVLADAVEALIGLDRLSEANHLLNVLEDQALALSHRWGTPAAERSRGLLFLALGDTDQALAKLDSAAHGFEAIHHPLDLGRTHLAAGRVLRRAGQRRRAAERLEKACNIFADLGAPLWHDRCEEELRRARPRRRREQQDLTAAESQVAQLVVSGRTNKEIAAEVFTSVATVEAHLTRIYRKIAVRSRTELTRYVLDGTVKLPNPSPPVRRPAD